MNTSKIVKTTLSSATSLVVAGALSANLYAQTVEGNDVTFSDLNHNQVEIEPLPDASADIKVSEQVTNYDSEKTLRFKDGISYQVGERTFYGTNDPKVRDKIHGLDADEAINAGSGSDIIYSSLGADIILGGDKNGDPEWDTFQINGSECNTPTLLDLVNFNHQGACLEGDVFEGIEAFTLSRTHSNIVYPLESENVQVTGGSEVDTAVYNKPYDDFNASVLSNGSLRVSSTGTQTYPNFEKVAFADGTFEDSGIFYIERSLDGSRNLYGTDGDDNFDPDPSTNAIMYSSSGCDHYDGRRDNWSTVSYLNANNVGSLEINAEGENNLNDQWNDSSCDSYEGIQAYVGSRNQKTYFISGPANEQFTANYEGSFAVYDGNIADYTITETGNNTVQITDNRVPETRDGSDILKNVSHISFDDGFYRDGESHKYGATASIDPASLPENYIGVAVYYGHHLDESLTEEGMKNIADHRMAGSLTPEFGSANSPMGEGTQVAVFDRSKIDGGVKTYNIPINGATMSEPMAFVIAAIMPVGNNNEVKAYHERDLSPSERYKAEIPVFSSITPRLAHTGIQHTNDIIGAGCYVKTQYPDQYQGVKDNAELSAAESLGVDLYLSGCE